MDSIRSFLQLWLGLSAAILGYAFLDLELHPWLREEQNFSMKPDLSRAPELVHWGGRLLRESHVSLLLANALILGGLLALTAHALMSRVRRPVEPTVDADVERVSVFPPQL
jgi:hypothetical protein